MFSVLTKHDLHVVLMERVYSGNKRESLKRKAEQPKCSNYRYMQNNSDEEKVVVEKVSVVKRKLNARTDALHYLTHRS